MRFAEEMYSHDTLWIHHPSLILGRDFILTIEQRQRRNQYCHRTKLPTLSTLRGPTSSS